MLTSTLTPSVSPLPPIDHVPSTSDLLGIDQSQRIQVALRIRAVNENRPSTSTLGAAHNHQKEMSMQSSPLSSSMSAAASEFSHQHSKSELLSPFSALKSLLSDSSSFSKLPLRSCIELKHSPPYQSLVIRDPEGRKRKKDYSYDHIFSPSNSQAHVYDACVRPLIQKCLEGFNGSVFCYGQTGSGKTYTMEGPKSNNAYTSKSSDEDPEQYGIILRAAKQISDHVKERMSQPPDAGKEKMEYIMKASYMEIYQEQLTDLLVDKNEQAELKIRMDPDSLSGKELYVQGLTERTVSKLDDFTKLLHLGSKRRTVGETNMNDVSSRSHAILTIIIDQYDPSLINKDETDVEDVMQGFPRKMNKKDGTPRIRSKIHLVDLAGSERADATGATGQRLKEGCAINQSLSSLGNVINALTSSSNGGPRHVPFRDSKLTFLLSDSLGGNSITLMIACVHPGDKNYEETVGTLRFAERVKKVQNKARMNVDPKLLRIMELEAQIEYYKGLLAKCTCEKRGQDTAGCQTHGGDHQKLAWWRRFITYSSGKCSEFVDATDGIIARDPRLSRIIRLRKQPNVGGNNEDDDEDNFDETGGIVNSAADSPHLFPQEQRQLDQRRLQQRLVSTHQTISSTTLFSSTSSRTTSTADVFNTASQLDGSATMTSSASASFKRFTSSTSAFIMKPRPIPWKQVSQRSIDSVITSTGSDAAAATTTSSNLNNNDKSAPVGLFKRQTSKKIVPSMA